MTEHDLRFCAGFLAALTALAFPLGAWMARVFEGRPCGLGRVLGPLERAIGRVCGIDPAEEMTWRRYAVAFLAFHFVGIVAVYAIQRLQGALFWNPERLPGVEPGSAFNTAVSFATNTNWQGYAGESTMSRLTQAAALAVQNFVSAGAGIAALLPVARGFSRERSATVGNFWVDLVRATLYVLLPLSVALALLLVSQGTPQTLAGDVRVPPLALDGGAKPAAPEQTIALGPVASQVAIKQLGTNGGGYYNANSAHPLENPTPLSNVVQLLAILLLPAALCGTFGAMVRDRRQGAALYATMLVIFVPCLLFVLRAESAGDPELAALGVDASAGNLEGKEVRHGVASSALWAVATTAASNGSVNAMHDSLTPVGGLFPMWLMQVGEVVFGGVGSGLYGLIVFALAAVFLGGLMVGRTPEYLGKKIEAFEMKAAALAILLPSVGVLAGTAIAVSCEAGRAGAANPGAHGFSEILYAFSSASNNNGSAFAGLNANTPFYNVALGIAMLLGRFGVALPALAIAGSLAAKKRVPPGAGTLPTHGPLFVTLLACVVVAVGALTFLPALALGPLVEHFACGR